METSALRGRPSFAMPGWLAIGDLVAIGLFLAAGELRHYSPGPAVERLPGTMLPFVIGWGIAAVVLGAYAADALESSSLAAVRGAVTWIGAAAIGLAIRATPYFHGGVEPTFAAVIAAVGVVSLGVWRGAVARVADQRRV